MSIIRLRTFVQDMTRLADHSAGDPDRMITAGHDLLADLISRDDWLPDFATEADPGRYRQYLLHCDPFERFSVVSFVWGPGQKTPIHDHTVWGLVGMLRGQESSKRFDKTDAGLVEVEEGLLSPGEIDVVSPTHGDIHQVTNALPSDASISIHVYGANIGAISRNVYDAATGHVRPFISAYSNSMVPNLWNAS